MGNRSPSNRRQEVDARAAGDRTAIGRVPGWRHERPWQKFHDSKSLILALTGEVGELAELFQSVGADDAVKRFAEPAHRQRAGEEIADVLLHLLRLADVVGVDVAAAARGKLAASLERFAARDVHGLALDRA